MHPRNVSDQNDLSQNVPETQHTFMSGER